MVYEINKHDRGNMELLPEIFDTPLWALIDPDSVYRPKRSDRLICELYMAIRERENYFQENTPMAFGNPVYSRRCGVVEGYLGAMEACEGEENGQIVIRRSSDSKNFLWSIRSTGPVGIMKMCVTSTRLLLRLGFDKNKAGRGGEYSLLFSAFSVVAIEKHRQPFS